MSSEWQVVQLQECSSTFTEARKYPAWTVVNTVRQSNGRGRFNRTWFGEEGGLWATYNLPLQGDHPWGVMPLVAGAALVQALGELGIPGLRLRWPNDLLVGRSKLAGILVERPRADIAAVGIGLNAFNSVQSLRGRTKDHAVRLADLVPHCPPLPELRAMVASSLAAAFATFMQQGMAGLMPLLDRAWGASLPVVAVTDDARICGFFAGITEDGSPILRRADGTCMTVPGHTVNELRELV